MADMENSAPVQASEEEAGSGKRRRKGRKPWTAAQKKEAAKSRAARKEKAENMKPAVLVQYQDIEADVDALVEEAKAAFRAVKKRGAITALSLYIKPEERAAYYVVNGSFDGKLTY